MTFIDIHAHAYRSPWPGETGGPVFSSPEQLLRRYDAIGVERAVLLPLVSPEFYLPQSNDEILDIVRQYPGRFVPFCNIDPRALSYSWRAPIRGILEHYKNLGCKGVGEITANLPFLDPLVQNLFSHVQALEMPVIFHIGPQIGGTYGLYDEPGLGQLERCLATFPRLKFLGHSQAFWAEIASLKNFSDRYGYPTGPVDPEGAVPRLMQEYPNLYGDLSAGSGCNALARDREYAIKFLNEFQDRLFFGLDICNPEGGTPLVDFLVGLRKGGQITDEVFRKIARTNAINLLGI